MSHNQKHYRKKITSKTSENCKKIDFLFKQQSLSSIPEPTISSIENDICRFSFTSSYNMDTKCDAPVQELKQGTATPVREVVDSSATTLNTKPRGDIEVFEKLFEAWKNQEGRTEFKERETCKKLELCLKDLNRAAGRVKDLEHTVELHQKVVKSLHNDLNLLDKVTNENANLKKEIEKIGQEIETKDANFRALLESKVSEINDLKAKHKSEMDEFKMKHEQDLKERTAKFDEMVKENQDILKKLEREKQLEIAKLSMEYENKIGNMQRQKLAATANQQQSMNQEIFRRKLQHQKSEHEREITSMKETIRQLQQQISAQTAKEGSLNKASFFNGAKRIRKF